MQQCCPLRSSGSLRFPGVAQKDGGKRRHLVGARTIVGRDVRNLTDERPDARQGIAEDSNELGDRRVEIAGRQRLDRVKTAELRWQASSSTLPDDGHDDAAVGEGGLPLRAHVVGRQRLLADHDDQPLRRHYGGANLLQERQAAAGHPDAVEPHVEARGIEPAVELRDERLVVGAGVPEKDGRAGLSRGGDLEVRCWVRTRGHWVHPRRIVSGHAGRFNMRGSLLEIRLDGLAVVVAASGSSMSPTIDVTAHYPLGYRGVIIRQINSAGQYLGRGLFMQHLVCC